MTDGKEKAPRQEREGQTMSERDNSMPATGSEVNGSPAIVHYYNDGDLVRPDEAPLQYNEDLGQKVPRAATRLDKADLPEEIKEGLAAPRVSLATVLALLRQLDSWEAAEAWLEPYERDLLARALPFKDAAPRLAHYQTNFFVVKDFGGKVRVCWHDSQGAFRTRSTGSFKEAEQNQRVAVTDAEGNAKNVAAADHWLNHANRHEYDEARFCPGQRTRPAVYNLWEGWAHGWQNGVPRKMKDHMLHHMCGGDIAVYEWVLGWLAHAVQKVHETPTTSLVLAGPQGSGKNVWFRLISQLFAPYALMCTQSSQLVGNFNSHLMDKLLVFANEAFFAGNKKEANTLKSLVTDETMIVEPKGVDAFQVKKHFRLILASNEDRVVDLELDDRRYCVLRADAGDFNNSRPYFAELIDAWENKGEREMFLKLLMDHSVDAWDEGAIPETEARREQRELSLRPPVRDVMNLLSAGHLTVVKDDEATGDVYIKAPAEWTRAHGQVMRMIGAERKQVRPHGRVWRLPPLGAARHLFATSLGVRMEWENSTAEWDVVIEQLPI